MSDAVTSNEEWRTVAGFEGLYEVSDLGRVRSLGRNTTSGRILRPWSHNSYGHLAVTLCRDGKRSRRYVHFLVAEAFHGARPDGLEVRHGNGKNTDNRACNLSWSSHAQNMADMVQHGTSHAAFTHCLRGHALDHPNLVVAALKRGWRVCRACRLARSRAWKAAKRGEQMDVQASSDRYYDWILRHSS